MTEPHLNLMAATTTLLPVDPVAEVDDTDLVAAVVAHPESCLGWALLAEQALREEDQLSAIRAYAFARTGYHRGLDQLRRNGWKGAGHVPWEHEPNRGFLRALWALSLAAGRIGETEEQQRCAQFLRDSSETAYQQLAQGEK